jgi:hypothetical protein
MKAEAIRGMVRPVVTIMLVMVLCALVVMERPIPEMFGTLAVSVISYWFGERSKR